MSDLAGAIVSTAVGLAIPIGVGLGMGTVGLLTTRIIQRSMKNPLDQFCPRKIKNYIEREFFDIKIASEIMISSEKKYVFLGPRGCGKSTTLCKMYQVLKSSIDHIVYIDLKNGLKGEQIKILSNLDNMLILIDNAQLLHDMNDEHMTDLKALLYSPVCQSSVLVYSQFIIPHSGSLPEFFSDGHSQIVWFRPFSIKEVEEYFRGYDDEKAVQAYSETCGIPHLISLYKDNLDGGCCDIYASMCFLVYYSVSRLEKIGNRDDRLIGDLCHLAFGFPPADGAPTQMLRFLGFIYRNQSLEFCATYPLCVLRSVLYSNIDMLTRLMGLYARGPELELKFSMFAQSCPLTFTSNRSVINVPKATEFIVQRSSWEIPTLQPGKCSIIKCAINHIAVDFIIVNDIDMALDAKYIILIQVSHQYYQHRAQNWRHCSIHQVQSTPNGNKSTSKYYRTHFAINHEGKAYYAYVSTETSIKHSIFEDDEVYRLGI